MSERALKRPDIFLGMETATHMHRAVNMPKKDQIRP